MKTIIKSSALLFAITLLSTGVFAADKNNGGNEPKKQDLVLFSALPQGCSVVVAVHKANVSAPLVTIFDKNGNAIMEDKLSKKDEVSRKGYDLSQLEEGDYTFKVESNNEVKERIVHVYNDNNQKTFFFKM